MNNEEQIELMKINDKTYMIIDKIDIYTYVVNEDDFKDMLILKDDGKDLVNLDNETEAQKALEMFGRKYLEKKEA
ncbi:MAG: hypothetical protein IJS56_00725 [Bacilli bacterium]|nr:hypothetical protein [Bacilli bacterium]